MRIVKMFYVNQRLQVIPNRATTPLEFPVCQLLCWPKIRAASIHASNLPSAACAAASLAIGTRNGEQLT